MSLRAMRPPNVIACDVNVLRPARSTNMLARWNDASRLALQLDVVDDRARRHAELGHGVRRTTASPTPVA